MPTWEYKAAFDIARAVDLHIRSSSAKSQRGHQLIGVYKDARRAASTAQTSPNVLNDIRKSLCIECRGDKLFPCDVDVGYSPNCAFVRNYQ
jgi:hypothetical protein